MNGRCEAVEWGTPLLDVPVLDVVRVVHREKLELHRCEGLVVPNRFRRPLQGSLEVFGLAAGNVREVLAVVRGRELPEQPGGLRSAKNMLGRRRH